MAIRKTLNFLPEIFRSETNKKFLNATLDQLISEPSLTRMNGFVGRKFSTLFDNKDNYILEPTADRQNYQLEPAVVAETNNKIDLFVDYKTLVDKIGYYGGINSDHDRLFRSDYYSYNPLIDFDKFSNYSQYYWMPNGPAAVSISAGVPRNDEMYGVIRSSEGYRTDLTGLTVNPELTLVRGATYTFAVLQGTQFWIQTEPGINGTKQYAPTVSTRDIFGVSNNGTNAGSIVFTVPERDAQDHYLKNPLLDYIHYAVGQSFSSLDGRIWAPGLRSDDPRKSPSHAQYSQLLHNLDGSTRFPDDEYIVFVNSSNSDSDWTYYTGSYVPDSLRRGVWQINIVEDASLFSGTYRTPRIRFTYIADIDVGTRVRSIYGSGVGTNAGSEYFKNSSGIFQLAQQITAPLSTLYYQDSTNPNFYGKIRIVDSPGNRIDVDTDIVGKKEYTSPTGAVFSNGMKVKFDTTVTPNTYHGKEYIVEGVGTSIKLVDFSLLVPIESRLLETTIPWDSLPWDGGPWDEPILGSASPEYVVIHRASSDLNAWSRLNRWVHIDVLTKVAEYNGTTLDKNIVAELRARRPIIEFKPDLQLFNHGRKFLEIVDRADEKIGNNLITNALELLSNRSPGDSAIRNLNIKEGQLTIFPYDSDPVVRSKIYRLGFTNQTNTTVFDGDGIGVITVRAGSDQVIDGTRLSEIPKTTFTQQLEIGSVLYTAAGQYIGKVKNIYGNSTLILESPATFNYTRSRFKFNKPRLSLSVHKTATNYDSVVVRGGVNAKRSYWFNGTDWVRAQEKSETNQEPSFDIIDNQGNSFGNETLYPKTKFNGCKIFGYTRGTGVNDVILGFPLKYNNTGNSLSDINFTNYFDTDSFTYKPYLEETKKVLSGFIRQNLTRTTFKKLDVWPKVDEPTKQYQHFSAVADGLTNYFEIDVQPATENSQSNIQVYVNNKLIDKSLFEIRTVGVRKAIYIEKTLTAGDKINIIIYSSQTSNLGYYEIPKNLEFNPQNTLVNYFTLGQIQNHWSMSLSNTSNIQGDPLGNNNSRDIGTFGSGTLLQHSAPLTYSALFLNDNQANLINGLDFARREYQKFKNKFLELCINTANLDPNNPMDGVDTILTTINTVKSIAFPWFYSDMLPYGKNIVVENFKILNSTNRTHNINEIFAQFGLDIYPGKKTSKAVSVYLNKKLLLLGRDYTIGPSTPSVQLAESLTIAANDILTVKAYVSTDGSFVPETPTKLGLYPKFRPEKYIDYTYRTPAEVIQGHDGSLTPSFGDIRDAYLLELETRIYNNIKNEYNKDLFDIYSLIPGKFRNTDYSIAEFNQVVTIEFLKWAGNNQLSFTKNSYFQSNDQFTWNYNQTTDTIDNELLLGHWRGIYKYIYDTDRPHTHPWEMLGFSEQPSWWTTRYGSAPYTSSNTTMWNDLEQGFNFATGTVDQRFKRPGLKNILPVDLSGNLLPPPSARLVKSFNGTKFSQGFEIGDHGPVETAWRRTSEYPFALQRAAALMMPAKYFGTLFDITDYNKNLEVDSYSLKSLNQRPNGKRTTINGETVNGKITRASGYINWIHGYLTSLGIDPIEKIRNLLNNAEVKLSYKLAGYTDKKYITALVEQFSPGSTNLSVVIPDENYLVYLNNGLAVNRATYSAVIVEKTSTGYSVNGYDLKSPFFTIVPSEFNGSYYNIETLNSSAVIFEDYRAEKINVPYGYEFTNTQQVVDFLVGYQRYLVSQGFVFNKYSAELKHVLDWTLSAREFLTWSQQGWRDGNIIVLSPVNNSLVFFSEDFVVGQITNQSNRSKLFGPNFNLIPMNEISVSRETNITTVTTVSGQTIALAELELVQKEHVLIFDNTTVFNDILYKPELGTRQYRIKLIGNRTADWQGGLEPPGFIYNSGIVDDWRQSTDYAKGDIVRYKNKNYTAIQDIPGSTAFNFDFWSVLDRKIDSGLSPNFSHNAQKFNEIYDVDSLSLDENLEKFSTGLIGFRNRPYLENLGMDQTTQVKFYQGYIKEKGTKNAISSLFGGYFDNVRSTVELYEEWAVRVGEYGSLNTNQSVELVLDEEKFKSNPSAFELLNYEDEATKNINAIRPNQILNSPMNYRSPIFLNRAIGEDYETDIKTAGYVNFNDIDGTVFDIKKYSSINNDVVSNLVDGYLLWVAKDFNEDWQVYQAQGTENSVSMIEYALDNKAKVTFTRDHGLQIGDIFAIRNFNSSFNGFYQVINTEEYNTVIIFINSEQIEVINATEGALIGNGEMFLFDQCRYRSIADRDQDYTKLPRETGDLVWVDNDNSGSWSVYSFVSGLRGNYDGLQSAWGIKKGSINHRSTGLPYHSFGVDEVSAADQRYNRIWPLNAGKNISAAEKVPAKYGITGFWLNGVPLTAPSIRNYAPGDYLLISDYDYNLAFSDYDVLAKDLAGGLIIDGVYSYNSFTFEDAWISGQGSENPGINSSADANQIGYLSGSLRFANGHSKILGFAMDGYPIYGPYGYAVANDSLSPVVQIRSSYKFKPSTYRVTESCNFTRYPMGTFIQDYIYVEGHGDLDSHNGRFCITPDYPNGTYAYFVTLDDNDNPAYPYAVGPTFYGPISESVNSAVPGAGVLPTTYVLSPNIKWEKTRSQQPKVDLRSIGSMYLYNNISQTILERLDYVDPAKGRILGTALADIDYISSFDPAKYNQGTSSELSIEDESHWGEKQVGTVWWDVDNLRYVDYEQSNLEYRIKHWGELFPGSTVEVYEWVMSDVLPSDYVSSGLVGTPKYIDNSAYATLNYVDSKTGIIKARYCYWVRGKTEPGLKSKTHSTYTLESMIRDPISQGISYVAILKDNSMMLYNTGRYLSGKSTVLHVDYKSKINENIIHSEFEMFQEGNPTSILNPRIENKLIDSLVGVDIDGNTVPDPSLLPRDRIGLSVRPRQSLIVDRLKAVKHVVDFVNSIFIKYPITTRIINNKIVYSDNFYAAASPPSESQYDYNVDTYIQLDYVPELNANALIPGKQYIIRAPGNTNFVLLGASNNTVGTVFTATAAGTGSGLVYPRRIYVKEDANYNNYWSVYHKKVDGTSTLVRIQSFDVTDYWQTIDWYDVGFNADTKIDFTVDSFYEIYKLSLINGNVIKVRNNGSNLFEVYQYKGGRLKLVGLQNGTIQLKPSLYEKRGWDFYAWDADPFDLWTTTELRFILNGLKQDIFVNDLAEYYNKFLFSLIEYILSEQRYVDWIFKTSFISVKHRFEGLIQSSAYIKDQEEFYKEYINEVKPYRTKLREYNLNYSGVDPTNLLAVSDFDLPAYYDKDLEIFRSPTGELPQDAALLANKPEYQDWNNNHTYEVQSIALAERGKGYLTAPDISIIGVDGTGTGANAVAAISSIDGSINNIAVTDPGSEYTSTPIVSINGTGYSPMSKYVSPNYKNAVASARLYNGKIRKLKTVIRFDRVQYTSNVSNWQAGNVYAVGATVSYQGKGYKNNSGASVAGQYFDFSKWTEVPSSSFDNANDRIVAYYQPTNEMVPKVLSRLIEGLDNPQANAAPSVDVDTLISGGNFKGSTIAPNLITVGDRYIITEVGNTNFVSMGAVENRVGVIFTATAAGSGTGKLVLAIGSGAFGNVGGISSEEIVVNGGAFVSDIFSHSPPELLPGIVYDSLNIRSVDTNNTGFRVFVSMNESRSRVTIDSTVRTSLEQDLDITDTTITVVNGSVLPSPVSASMPGIIYVNGERIEYFVKNGNVLSNIRRGAGGTGAPVVHAAGSVVEGGNNPYT